MTIPPLPSIKSGPLTVPISQERKGFRANWPSWLKQMPVWGGPKPDESFQLIDQQQLLEVIKDFDPDTRQRILDDRDYMEKEILRLFREVDYQAKLNQNSYRLYQIGYILLAALATLLGSLQALTLNTQTAWLPWLAFGEVLVALFATYLSTLSSREPPMQRWLDYRTKAENMRREYFRYLMNLQPYDRLERADRRRLLSRRAADIYRGVFPDNG